MNLETLARLGEFVGGFFVLVSLVYLAYQVRQNTRSLQAENYARMLERISSVQSTLSADGELNRIVTVGALSPDQLSRSERVRFSWALYELLGAAEFMFHQTEQGALPGEVWERWRATLAWWMSNPGFLGWWRAKPSPFSRTFEAFVDDLIDNNPVDRGAIERWQHFLEADGPPSEAGGPDVGRSG